MFKLYISANLGAPVTGDPRGIQRVNFNQVPQISYATIYKEKQICILYQIFNFYDISSSPNIVNDYSADKVLFRARLILAYTEVRLQKAFTETRFSFYLI